MNKGEDGVGLGLIHLAAADLLGEEIGAIGLALLGGLLRLVDQHRLDARHRLHICDACAHHPCAQHRDLLDLIGRHALGPRRALAQLLHGQKQGADHGLRLGRRHGLQEVAGLDAKACVDGDLQAFIEALQDVQLGGIVAIGLLAQHGVAHDEDLRAAGGGGAAAGDLEVLFVPARHRVALILDPGLGRRHDLISRNHGVDEAKLQRFLRGGGLALQDQARRGLQADQAGQTLRAACARQKADLGFGQAQLDLRIVRHDAVVGGQRDLQTAAEGKARQGAGDRLAAGLHGAEGAVQKERALELRLQLLVFGQGRSPGPAHGARPHFTEIRAGAEAGGLARHQHRALDGGVGLDALDDLRELLDHLAGEGVHAAAGHVEGDQRHAVRVDLNLEVFHVSQVL